MAFSSMKDLLGSVLTTKGNWQIRLMKDWPLIVGDLQVHMRLERVLGNVLVVGVYDSHWLHELSMLSPMVVQTINDHLGGAFVTRIRFIVVERKEKKSEQPASRERELSMPEVAMNSRQEYVLRSVKDVQLQKVLEKVFYRCVV
ncbi:MAG: hypothetical protein UV38_C0001G0175 [candidate division TM6 bacterium GW2011_GWE2_42_60]|nr:MAG: hypothetical protein UV38_C0001G0175 [candidate division TM6 bacterium GW2011_GWE2_42_60]